MKTAMELAIELIQDAKNNFPKNGYPPTFGDGFNYGIKVAISLIQHRMDKEKEQIIDAYLAGIEGIMNDYTDAKKVGNTIVGIKTSGGAEKYYNDNYKKK